MYFCGHTPSVSGVCNMMLFLSIHRRETESRLHHPSTWRCRTHDCGDANEEYYKSG